jgi:hypothetical protein
MAVAAEGASTPQSPAVAGIVVGGGGGKGSLLHLHASRGSWQRGWMGWIRESTAKPSVLPSLSRPHHTSSSNTNSSSRDPPAGTPAFWSVAGAASPAALSLFASVGSSMMAFPFFSYIPTTGRLGSHVSQAAFYARLGGDIAGRLLPPSLQARTVPRLLAFAAAKAALLPLLLPALLRPTVVGGDVGLVALVAGNWALGGYVNTGAYLLAPSLVGSAQQRSRVGGFMAFSFQVCFPAIHCMPCWHNPLSRSVLLGLTADHPPHQTCPIHQVSCFVGLMLATALAHILHRGEPDQRVKHS